MSTRKEGVDEIQFIGKPFKEVMAIYDESKAELRAQPPVMRTAVSRLVEDHGWQYAIKGIVKQETTPEDLAKLTTSVKGVAVFYEEDDGRVYYAHQGKFNQG